MKQAFLICLLLASTGAWAQAVFKYVDENGVTHYSDRPPPEGTVSERMNIETARTDPEVVSERRAVDAARFDESNKAIDERLGAAAQAREEQEAEKDRRRVNCNTARQKQTQYYEAERLFRTNEQGEKEYLDSPAIDQARAKADADVAEWCD